MCAKSVNDENTKNNTDDDIEKLPQSDSIGLLKTCSNISSKFSHGIDRFFYG